MTHHKLSAKLSGMYAALLFTLTLLPDSALSFMGAGGVSVIDHKANGQLAESVAAQRNHMVELNLIRALEQQQLNAFGRSGPMGTLRFQNEAGIDGSNPGFRENMRSLAFDPCAVNLCQIGSNPAGTTDVGEARDWAMENFYSREIVDPLSIRDLREVRRRAIVSASVNAMALATVTRNELAASGGRIGAFEEAMSGSLNLREDLRINSAIALAAYKATLQQLAIAASLLEVSATSNIADSDIYHEAGGSRFPDALIDADFAPEDPLKRISVTAPVRGVSGNGGFKGSLLASALEPALWNMQSNKGNSYESPIGEKPKIAFTHLSNANPENITMYRLVADSASLANNSHDSGKAPKGIPTALNLIERGLFADNFRGRAQAIMGLAKIHAIAEGDELIAESIDIGVPAMNSREKAVEFANGVVNVITASESDPQYADYIRDSISEVNAGNQDPYILVLDATAVLAGLAGKPGGMAKNLLLVDATAADGGYFRERMSEAMVVLSEHTGYNRYAEISKMLEDISESDLQRLGDKIRQGSNADLAPQ